MLYKRRIEIMSTTAHLMVGKPCIWAANGADAFDSGALCREIADSAGLGPKRDLCPADLYGFFMANKKTVNDVNDIAEGDFLFFGGGAGKIITHTAYAICPEFMIEAGGGGRQTTNFVMARKAGAMVRIRPISNRSDLLYAVSILGGFRNEQ